MARIRTIKPEFWVDDVMVELPPLARLQGVSTQVKRYPQLANKGELNNAR